jgi:hypothetical protein
MTSAKGIAQVSHPLADFKFEALDALDKGNLVALVKILALITFGADFLLSDMILEEKSEMHAETLFHNILPPAEC